MSTVDEKIKKVKTKINKTGKKKIIENIIAVFALGLVLIIAGGAFGNKKDNVSTNNEIADNEVLLEKRLEDILTNIQGAGNVKVFISYENNGCVIPIYDTRTTINKSNNENGNNQETIEKDVVYEQEGSTNKSAAIMTVNNPEIKGVVVVAQGANSALVRERLTQAVSVALDLEIYKIEVCPMK